MRDRRGARARPCPASSGAAGPTPRARPGRPNPDPAWVESGVVGRPRDARRPSTQLSAPERRTSRPVERRPDRADGTWQLIIVAGSPGRRVAKNAGLCAGFWHRTGASRTLSRHARAAPGAGLPDPVRRDTTLARRSSSGQGSEPEPSFQPTWSAPAESCGSDGTPGGFVGWVPGSSGRDDLGWGKAGSVGYGRSRGTRRLLWLARSGSASAADRATWPTCGTEDLNHAVVEAPRRWTPTRTTDRSH
jgi:hypothetical protein